MKKERKEMEYADAPSGFVMLYNYKEPFMKFDNGFGFQGVLLFDGQTERVQCHFCGEWIHYLPKHLHKEHNMTAAQYKDQVGLRQSSVLISESTREKLVAINMDKRKKNLIAGRKKSEATKKKIGATLAKKPRENQNVRGTCPLQLIERLRTLHDTLGRTPLHEEIKFSDTLKEVFGSIKRAMEIARIEPRKNGVNLNHWSKKTTDQDLLNIIKNFREIHGREPSTSDYRRGLIRNPNIYIKRFGSWKKAKQLALAL